MSGDHPVTPIFSQPVDVVSWLRCEADAAAREPAPWEMLSKAASEIERLRAERDEARKLLCDEIWMSRGGRMSVDAIAKERGWDCFEKDGNA